MAFITYPLNNIDYTAEDAELFHCTRTSGIWAEDSFPISVTGADNNVTIGTGIAWINNEEFSGKVAALKSAEVLDLGIADSTYPRIDVIAIQYSANNNATDVVIKKGTPATNPVRPSIVRTGAVYELYLASVYRPAGATAITASNITDLRMDTTVCGLMADSVTKIDMDAIRAQLMGLVEELEEAIQNIEVGEIVPIEKGGTNAKTSAKARQNINLIGLNPITSVEQDTTANWIDLGTGFAVFNTSGLITDQPYPYGAIQNIVADGVVYQMWQDLASNGYRYVRTGDISSGWYGGGAWKKIDNKSAITVSKSAAQTLSTSATKIAMGSTLTSTGDLFALSNGGVLVKKDCVVEVSGSIYIGSGLTNGDAIYAQIYRDTANFATVAATQIHAAAGHLSISPVIMSVKAGQTIYPYAYNATGARGNLSIGPGNRFTVKEI